MTYLRPPAIPRRRDRDASEKLLPSFLRIRHGLREEYCARAGPPHRFCLDELPEGFRQPGQTRKKCDGG
jgi:hypothetical protein